MKNIKIEKLRKKIQKKLTQDNPESLVKIACEDGYKIFPRDCILCKIGVHIRDENTENLDLSALQLLTGDKNFSIFLETKGTVIPDLEDTKIKGIILNPISEAYQFSGNLNSLDFLTLEINTHEQLLHLPQVECVDKLLFYIKKNISIETLNLTSFKNINEFSIFSDNGFLDVKNIIKKNEKIKKIEVINNALSYEVMMQLASMSNSLHFSQMDIDFKKLKKLLNKNNKYYFSRCKMINESIVEDFENIFVRLKLNKEEKYTQIKNIISGEEVPLQIGDKFIIKKGEKYPPDLKLKK